MKRGFISVYVLIILLFISVSLAFLARQVQNNTDIKGDLYDRKQAIYDAESQVNIFYAKNQDQIKDYILDDYKRKIDDTTRDTELSNVKAYFINYKNKEAEVDLNRVVDRKINRNREKIYKISKILYYKNVQAEADIFLKPKDHILLKSDSPLKYSELKDSLEKIQFRKDRSIYGTIPATSESSPYYGLVCIDGDLNLDKDLYIDGILLVKGKINTKGKTLKVKGQLICENNDIKDIDFKKDNTPIINSVDNKRDLIDLEIMIRKVF